jgi:hypothetical protein
MNLFPVSLSTRTTPRDEEGKAGAGNRLPDDAFPRGTKPHKSYNTATRLLQGDQKKKVSNFKVIFRHV